MSKSTSDRVWYWVGGTDQGVWYGVRLEHGSGGPQVQHSLLRMGYHAIIGSAAIGPPEGAPRVLQPGCTCACCAERARAGAPARGSAQ
jgi:hypothetical protein